MYYLITATPILLTHGTYHYDEISKDQALQWLEKHHKELTVAQVTSTPNLPNNQTAVHMQFVQLLAKQIDRYLPQEQKPLPALQHHDEVLVVHQKPSDPQNPQQLRGGFGGGLAPGQQQPLGIERLSFALFKRTENH